MNNYIIQTYKMCFGRYNNVNKCAFCDTLKQCKIQSKLSNKKIDDFMTIKYIKKDGIYCIDINKCTPEELHDYIEKTKWKKRIKTRKIKDRKNNDKNCE